MRIFITLPTGEDLPLKAESFDTVGYVAGLIQKKEGFIRSDYKLMFGNLCLKDSETLADYNIQNGSILEMVLHDDAVGIAAVQARKNRVKAEAEAGSCASSTPKIESMVNDCVRTLERQLQEYKDELQQEKERNNKLEWALDVERRTGSCFLKSENGRHFMVLFDRQATFRAYDKDISKSEAIKELLTTDPDPVKEEDEDEDSDEFGDLFD